MFICGRVSQTYPCPLKIGIGIYRCEESVWEVRDCHDYASLQIGSLLTGMKTSFFFGFIKDGSGNNLLNFLIRSFFLNFFTGCT